MAFGQGPRGGAFSNVLAQQLVLSPAAVNTVTSVEQTFTCPGIPASTTAVAIVIVNCTAPLAGTIVGNVRVSAVNQIGIQFANPTAGNLTPTASTTYNVVAMW